MLLQKVSLTCLQEWHKSDSLPSELGLGPVVGFGADLGTGAAVAGTGTFVGAGPGVSVPDAVRQQNGGRGRMSLRYASVLQSSRTFP